MSAQRASRSGEAEAVEIGCRGHRRRGSRFVWFAVSVAMVRFTRAMVRPVRSPGAALDRGDVAAESS